MPGCLLDHKSIPATCLLTVFLTLGAVGQTLQKSGGTLVVAVPVSEGVVVCSDKRLYNETTGKFRDDYVKIHRVGDKALFVATHTTGFLNKTSGKMEFDIFDVTQHFVSQNGFATTREYWNSLRNEIRKKLSVYLSKQRYSKLPETDAANNRLLFNLVFFAADRSTVNDYSLSVFYEKAQTPIIDVGTVVTETVRTPKLLGKGKEVMLLLASDPSLSRNPSIQKFDQSVFSIQKTSVRDAVEFASRLINLTSTNLPEAEVSASYDCALLSFTDRFSWLDESGRSTSAK